MSCDCIVVQLIFFVLLYNTIGIKCYDIVSIGNAAFHLISRFSARKIIKCNINVHNPDFYFSRHFRYSRQKISLEDENEDSSKTSNDKDRNANENNNIEGQENLNKPATPQSTSEKSAADEKEWSPSSDSTNSVEDDQGNMVPWREKLKKSDEK